MFTPCFACTPLQVNTSAPTKRYAKLFMICIVGIAISIASSLQVRSSLDSLVSQGSVEAWRWIRRFHQVARRQTEQACNLADMTQGKCQNCKRPFTEWVAAMFLTCLHTYSRLYFKNSTVGVYSRGEHRTWDILWFIEIMQCVWWVNVLHSTNKCVQQATNQYCDTWRSSFSTSTKKGREHEM